MEILVVLLKKHTLGLIFFFSVEIYFLISILRSLSLQLPYLLTMCLYISGPLAAILFLLFATTYSTMRPFPQSRHLQFKFKQIKPFGTFNTKLVTVVPVPFSCTHCVDDGCR